MPSTVQNMQSLLPPCLLVLVLVATNVWSLDPPPPPPPPVGRMTPLREVRSYDGSKNNLEHETWGCRDSLRVRQFPALSEDYVWQQTADTTSYLSSKDGTGNATLSSASTTTSTSTTSTTNTFTTVYYKDRALPSARRVMEKIFHQALPHQDKTASHILLEFGHFIVQDILGASSTNETEATPIPCDGELMDWIFCPMTGWHTGTSNPPTATATATTNAQNLNQYAATTMKMNTIPFFRQVHGQLGTTMGMMDDGDGDDLEDQDNTLEDDDTASSTSSKTSRRATRNSMTSFLDLSNLYGMQNDNTNNNNNTSPSQLRGPRGTLRLNEQGLTPEDFHVDYAATFGFNTSPGAYCFYVLFMRYHNYVANEILQLQQQDDAALLLSEDDIFELARQQTIAVYQSFVEEKYLPTLLGDTLPVYTGYKASVDPSMDEFFAAVSFRYGHSSLSKLVVLLDKNYHALPESPLLLRDTFKQDVPSIVAKYSHGEGIEPFLRGMTVTPAKAIDASMVEDINVWAEGTSVLDVQRGRDLGIPRYNDVREAMGLHRMASLEELVGLLSQDEPEQNRMAEEDANKRQLLLALQELYDNDIDLVDAYVGALMEAPETPMDNMGPLFVKSIKDQFTRIRDGDRFWYKNLYPPEVYEGFPDLSALVKLLCDDMDLFPDDPYLLVSPRNNDADGKADDSASCQASMKSNQLSLLGGSFVVRWELDLMDNTVDTIDVTLRALEEMEEPGYIGIGWGKQVMNGANIWFCTINEDAFYAHGDLPDKCPTTNRKTGTGTPDGPAMFSCCLAPGTNHKAPVCSQSTDDLYYELEVLDWCLTPTESSVTIRAPLCSGDDDNSSNANGEGANQKQKNCFGTSSSPDGKMDFIVSYNPMSSTRPHGYQRRTSAQVDLMAGVLTESEVSTADSGLIATHGVFMLIGWMLVAPWAVFIARFFKTKSWRLVAHISMMGFVGSTMIPLLIGVEASVGATSDKTQEHSLVGIFLMSVFFLMAGTGRFRYLKWQGHKIGKKTNLITRVFHKYGGMVIIGLAWWNCYTGLVRIGPEDSNFELVVLSSYSMGYDIDIFGFIRKYLYWPYLGFVILAFVVAEIRQRSAGDVQSKMKHAGSLWDDDGSDLETMTMETFLDVSRLGTSLCVVDDRVLDISEFIEHHPGGPEVLRYVRGSDITDEFLGQRDVDGIRHVHSRDALLLMKRFLKAKLVRDGCEEEPARGRGSIMRGIRSRPSNSDSRVYRRAKIIDVKYLAPSCMLGDHRKPCVLLRVALPRSGGGLNANEITRSPGSSFTFRGIDKRGMMFERQYTPVKINRDDIDSFLRPGCIGLSNFDLTQSSTDLIASSRNLTADLLRWRKKEDDEEFDFIISLIPNGQMSNFLLSLKNGKMLLASGPTVSQMAKDQLERQDWKSIVMLASGTGISSMLQLIDYYLTKAQQLCKCPSLFLIWIVRSPKDNYGALLGLESRVKRFRGRLKWVTIYSTHIEKDHRNHLRKSTGFTASIVDAPRASEVRPSQKGAILSQAMKFWKRDAQQMNVKSLVGFAQNELRMKQQRTEEFNAIGSEDFMKFHRQFWEKNKRVVQRQLDQFVVKELFLSIDDYTKEKAAEQCDVAGDQALSVVSEESEESEKFDSDELAFYSTILKSCVKVADHVVDGGSCHAACFVSKEAVDLLYDDAHVRSRDEAVEVVLALLRAEMIEQVTQGYLSANASILFRFVSPASNGHAASEFGASVESKSVPDAAPSLIESAEADITLGAVPPHAAEKPLSLANGAVELEEDDEDNMFEGILAVMCGSPMFNVDMAHNLANFGFPTEQMLTF